MGGSSNVYVYLDLVDLYQCISPRGPAGCGEIAQITLPETNSKFAPENRPLAPKRSPSEISRAGILQYKTVLPAYKMMSFHFLNYMAGPEKHKFTSSHATSMSKKWSTIKSLQNDWTKCSSSWKNMKQNPTDPAAVAGPESHKVGIWQIELLKKLKNHNVHAPKSHVSSQNHCWKFHNPNQRKTYFP